jgi:hypothetical protein
LGSDATGSTATNTWTFVNNNIILPPGGDILDSNGVSVLGGATTITIALPSWITVVSGTEHLPTLNTDYGWDSSGAWCTNATILENEEGTSFPFRTTFSIPNDTKSVTTVDFVVNELEDSDFGIAVFASGTTPEWVWGDDGNGGGGITISAKYTPTELYGISGNGGSDSWTPPSLGTYRARLTVEPTGPGTADIMLETLDTSNNILDTLTYTETEFFGTDYKIGFASDNDGGVNKTYFKNLTIDIGDGATVYTDTLMNGSSTGGTTTALGDRLTAGSSSVVLSSTGTLTLPQGGTISEVTVDDGIRDPSVGILLTPYADPGTNPDMAVKIYPTFNDDDHIHIVAGNPTTVDLFLGDDDQYVKLEQNSGNIVVGTNTTVTNSTWTFGTDGVLTLSTASTILGTGTDPNVYIETATTSTTSTWTFGTDGVLTLPASTPIIKGSGTGTDVTVVATTGSNTATWVFAADGVLTLPNGMIIDASDSIPTVKIGGSNTQIRIDDDGAPPGLYIRTDMPGEDHVWLFGPDGSLAFPNGATGGNSQIYTTNGGNQTVFETFNTDDGQGAGQKLTLDYDAAEVKIQTQTGTEWTFGQTGTLTLPNGATIVDTTSTLVLTPNSPGQATSLVLRSTYNSYMTADYPNDQGYQQYLYELDPVTYPNDSVSTGTEGTVISITLWDAGGLQYVQGDVEYIITGTGITAADFTPAVLTGTFAAANWTLDGGGFNYTNTNMLMIANDAIVEGEETFTVTIITTGTYAPGSGSNYLRVNIADGTTEGSESGHIHLISENMAQTSIFLGNDDKYVKVAADDQIYINVPNVNTSATSQLWTFAGDGSLTLPDGGDIKNSSGTSVLTVVTGQETYEFDGVNTTLTITNVTFNLLFCTMAGGYTGSDGHTVLLPAGTAGQRLVIVNISSLCTLTVDGAIDGAVNVAPEGTAELIYLDGAGVTSWWPLYGTTLVT